LTLEEGFDSRRSRRWWRRRRSAGETASRFASGAKKVRERRRTARLSKAISATASRRAAGQQGRPGQAQVIIVRLAKCCAAGFFDVHHLTSSISEHLASILESARPSMLLTWHEVVTENLQASRWPGRNSSKNDLSLPLGWSWWETGLISVRGPPSSL